MMMLVMLLSSAKASTTHVEVELLVTTTTAAAATTKWSAAAEERREDVVKVHVMELLASPWLSLHLLMLSHAFFSLLVINATLFLVGQYFIRISNFLELLLRPIWIVLVLVWMVLYCEFFEPLLDFSICGISFDTKDFV